MSVSFFQWKALLEEVKSIDKSNKYLFFVVTKYQKCNKSYEFLVWHIIVLNPMRLIINSIWLFRFHPATDWSREEKDLWRGFDKISVWKPALIILISKFINIFRQLCALIVRIKWVANACQMLVRCWWFMWPWLSKLKSQSVNYWPKENCFFLDSKSSFDQSVLWWSWNRIDSWISGHEFYICCA